MREQGRVILLRMLLSRAAGFAFIWWLLTEAQSGSWGLGIPAVFFATMVSLAIVPRMTISVAALLRFIPFFLYHSLQGGVDVASRALHPQLPISPVFVDYPLRLPGGLPRVLMLNVVSLLPGTLSAQIDNATLRVHVLDGQPDIRSRLQTLEQHVADLFLLSVSAVTRDHSPI